MNIAEKTRRIETGEDSQHGTHAAVVQERPAAISRLRALLRGEAEAWSSPATSTTTESADASADGSNKTKAGSTASVPDEEVTIESMTVAELRDEIDWRNTQRPEDDQLLVSGLKAELVARLENDTFKYPGD